MKLKQFLKENNLKMTEFAILAGVSQGFISLVCNGKRRPSPEIALQIEKATGKKVTVLELLYPEVDGEVDIFNQEASSLQQTA